MFKSILKLIKKVVISIIVLYGYNLATQSLNLNIPINIITVIVVTIFEGSGFLGLVAFYLLNFR